MENDVLTKLENIEKKVDYVYKRVKEIEEFANSSLPLLSDVADRITEIISRVEDEIGKDELSEKLKKIKENIDVLLDTADKIVETREQLSYALKDVRDILLENIEMEVSPEEAVSLLRKLIIYMPAFSKMIDDALALYSLIEDLKEVKIAEEVQDTVRELREKLEREEIIILLKKFGDILPKLPQMLDDMLSLYNLMEDLRRALPELEKEAMPTISELRERFEREEVLEVVKRLGDVIPRLPNTIDSLISLYEVADELKLLEFDKEELDRLKTALGKIKKKEVIDVLEKFADTVPILSKTADTIIELDRRGVLDAMFKLSKVVEPLSRKLSDRALEDMGDSLAILARTAKPELAMIASHVAEAFLNLEPKKAGLMDLMRALSDERVQIGLGVSLELLRALADAVKKMKMREEQKL